MSMVTIPPTGTDDTRNFEQAIAAGQSIQFSGWRLFH
jgi:hypothetical protein